MMERERERDGENDGEYSLWDVNAGSEGFHGHTSDHPSVRFRHCQCGPRE